MVRSGAARPDNHSNDARSAASVHAILIHSLSLPNENLVALQSGRCRVGAAEWALQSEVFTFGPEQGIRILFERTTTR